MPGPASKDITRFQARPGRDRRLLFQILLISVVAFTASWFAITEAEHRLLKNEARATAIHWSTFLQDNLSELGDILASGLISADDQRVFNFAAAAGGVFRFEVIRRDGITALSSWSGDFHKANKEADLAAVLKDGKLIINLFERESFSARPMVVSEAYLPITIGGRIEGAIKVYIDVTMRAAALARTRNFTLVGLFLLLSVIGVLCGSFVWRNIRDRNRELMEIIKSRERVLVAERALRASEERYRSLLEKAMIAITVHNGDEILYANEAAVQLYRAASVQDLLGRNPLDLIHPDERDSVQIRHAAVNSDQRTPAVEQRRIRFDGSSIDVECAGSPIIWEGRSCILSEVRDVTERKQAEEVMRRAKEEAELASRGKSEFLANMSHELRTPLNAIIGFSEIMRQEMHGSLGDPKYQEYSRHILESGIHLLDVINDILDLSKIEAGKLEIFDEVFRPETALENSLLLVKERAKSGNVKMSMKIAEQLPSLRADQRKIKQILINLISNAVKFTPSGGDVTIEIDVNNAGELSISVIDTGIGIKPEDITKAMKPFGQVDSALSRKFEGTGLGLPLAKSLVELHDGTFVLESAVGIGTTVTVKFPPERLVA